MRKTILSLAKIFLQLPTSPYREHNIREFILKFCDQRNIPYQLDTFGNVMVTFGIHAKRPRFSFVAHMDHPGFIAEKNSSNNHGTALFYGGWDPTEFKSAPIRFFTKNNQEVTAKALKWEKAARERAWRAHLVLNAPIKKGDIGMWDFDPFKTKGNLLYSRNCDDSIGCILILSLLDYFNVNQSGVSFLAVFTCAEESGLHGAKHICINNYLQKNCIPISVETSRELQNAKIGDGVIVRVGDSHSIFTPEITNGIVDIAKKLKVSDNDFHFQRKLMDGGQCEATVFTSFGYKTGALSIPLGNYHNRNFVKKTTESEYVSVQDMVHAFTLMKTMVENTAQFAAKQKNLLTIRNNRYLWVKDFIFKLKTRHTSPALHSLPVLF